MNREYHKWFSHSLQRDMELLVFGYGGKAVLFFPTRMARFYDYENWGVVGALASQIEKGELQLFCVDSIDSESFYNNNEHPEVRIARHRQYQDYLINEVVQLIYKINGGAFIQTAGCSMGAYHAVNLAMKYPWLFKRAVGFSGRYDLTQQLGDFKDLLNGYRSDEIYFNMPMQFVPNLSDGYLLAELSDLEVILVVGKEDPFLASNIELEKMLRDKELPNQLHIWEGNAHRAADWRQMAKIYF